MKKSTKIAGSLLMAVTMMAATICGCSNNSNDNASNANPDSGSEEAKQITVTAFTQGPGEIISNFGENEFFQHLAERTGVTIEFQHAVTGNEQQELDLMFSSGEYADIIMSYGSEYKGGDDAAVEDGVYRDLTDYVEEYMPNYWALINSNDEVKRMAYTDGGRIVNIVSVEYDASEGEIQAQPAFAGIAIRKDWLDELNLEVPVTYDDWTNVLRAFRDEKGCAQPLYFPPSGYWMLTQFAAGYGSKNMMQVDDGVISYGPMLDGWKKYVTLLHQWYEEGLIGSEYLTNDAFGMDVAAMGTNQSGATFMVYTVKDIIEGMNGEGANLVACQLPVENAGEVAQAGANDGQLVALKYYISTHLSDEKLPQVLAMFDYLYTEEGALFQGYGVEGDTYTLDENGKPVFTDKILNNPDGLTTSQAIDVYLCPRNLQIMKDWSSEYVSATEAQIEMCNVWDMDGTDMHIPALSLNSEESSAYSNAMVDVETYMQEMTNKFIMGTADIETEWETYVQTMKDMKVENAIAAYQSAYDSYMDK